MEFTVNNKYQVIISNHNTDDVVCYSDIDPVQAERINLIAKHSYYDYQPAEHDKFMSKINRFIKSIRQELGITP